jgi:hypothetical protein
MSNEPNPKDIKYGYESKKVKYNLDFIKKKT